MKSIALFMTAALMVMGPSLVNAELTPGEMQLNRAAIQTRRNAIVDMNMKMDTAAAEVFWPLYNDYIEALQPIQDRSAKLLTDFTANWLDLSDEKAASLISEFFSIKQEQLKVKKSFLKKFSKSLPPKLVARFFQIDNKLDAIIANELAQNVPLVH